MDFRTRSKLLEQWRVFLLQFQWQYFATLTFRPDVRTGPVFAEGERARKVHRVYLRLLYQKLYGRAARGKIEDGRVAWCLATEYHKSGKIHFHALYAGDDLHLLGAGYMAELWAGLAGWAKIEAIYNGQGAVAAYTSKYVAKGGQIDLSAGLRSAAPAAALLKPVHLPD